MTRPVVEVQDRPKQVHTSIYPGSFRQWDWQNHAACNNVDEMTQHQFTSIPAGRDSRRVSRQQAEELRERYCSDCPVILQCKAWADRDMHFVGVAAGKAYHDRAGRTGRRGKVQADA